MPIRINEGTVATQFTDSLPRSAGYAEEYLRAVARGVQAWEPPVRMSLDILTTGGFRATEVQCLVVEPTAPKLRSYKTAHFATPSGGMLNIGWYLVGAERADGVQFGPFAVGALSQIDLDEVMSIVETVHTYAVLPAMQYIVDLVRGGTNQPGGFVGA